MLLRKQFFFFIIFLLLLFGCFHRNSHTNRMKCAFVGVVLACLWAMAAVCVTADHVPYRYNVSLDEPPKKRYYAVVRDICRDPVHKEALLAVYDSIAAEAANYTGIAGFYMKNNFPDVYEELEFVPPPPKKKKRCTITHMDVH